MFRLVDIESYTDTYEFLDEMLYRFEIKSDNYINSGYAKEVNLRESRGEDYHGYELEVISHDGVVHKEKVVRYYSDILERTLLDIVVFKDEQKHEILGIEKMKLEGNNDWIISTGYSTVPAKDIIESEFVLYDMDKGYYPK